MLLDEEVQTTGVLLLEVCADEEVQTTGVVLLEVCADELVAEALLLDDDVLTTGVVLLTDLVVDEQDSPQHAEELDEMTLLELEIGRTGFEVEDS